MWSTTRVANKSLQIPCPDFQYRNERGRGSSQQEVLNIATMEEESQELSRIKERDYVRVKDQRLVEVQRVAATDPEQRTLNQVIRQGGPPEFMKSLQAFKVIGRFESNCMVIQDGIIYKGGQVEVPQLLREDDLRRLHSSHMGSEATLRRAKDAVNWPKMAEDITRVTKQCPVCEEATYRQITGAMIYQSSHGLKSGWIYSQSEGKNTS